MKNSPQSNQPTLIITRPAEQSASLLAQLKPVLGGTMQLKQLALIKIVAKHFTLPTATNFDNSLFISSNAAHYFFEQLAKNTDTCSLGQLFAVGENSAASVQQLSAQTVIYPPQMNSEGLLALPELAAVSGQHWLIVKGEGGRSLIKQKLLAGGAKVTELDVYQRSLPELAIQQQIRTIQSDDPIWLITSGQALANLQTILGMSQTPQSDQAARAVKVIVSSDRLADKAIQMGFTIFAQSAGASELQLIQCVKTLVPLQD